MKLLLSYANTGPALDVYRARLAQALKAFARDERPRSERGWRILNEVPTLALIVIVVMVIAKPF